MPKGRARKCLLLLRLQPLTAKPIFTIFPSLFPPQMTVQGHHAVVTEFALVGFTHCPELLVLLLVGFLVMYIINLEGDIKSRRNARYQNVDEPSTEEGLQFWKKRNESESTKYRPKLKNCSHH